MSVSSKHLVLTVDVLIAVSVGFSPAVSVSRSCKFCKSSQANPLPARSVNPFVVVIEPKPFQMISVQLTCKVAVGVVVHIPSQVLLRTILLKGTQAVPKNQLK